VRGNDQGSVLTPAGCLRAALGLARRHRDRAGAAHRRLLAALATGAVLAWGFSGLAIRAALAHDPELEPGPDLPAPDFVPPAPGTYTLHRIMRAPDGDVLDVEGRAQRLSRFTTGKITLLGFVYTSCSDLRGCPLAYQVFHTIRDRVARASALHAEVRLVTLSFDPARDSPGVMKRYAGDSADSRVEWAFLTTRSAIELVPLLDGFGQDVRVLRGTDGDAEQPTLGHVLKVFLIDRVGMVREIYTTSYLVPDVVLNDIATLLLETGRRIN
jgi:cytochrome oxidase Cu insertion factor (SCO1/SenC/PrrC family)